MPGSVEQTVGVFPGSKVVAVNSTPVADIPSYFGELAKSAGVPVRLDLTFPPPVGLGQPPSGAAPQPGSLALSPCPPGTCGFCRSRPVFKGSFYCGKGCMSKAQQAGWVDGAPPAAGAGGGAAKAAAAPSGACPAGSCPFCHSKGVSKPVALNQPYCGRTCGQAARAAGWVDGTDPAAVTAATNAGTICRQCFQKPQQKGHPYCSKSCAKAFAAAHQWIAPKQKTATKGVCKYTIDSQLSGPTAFSAKQTEDAIHFAQAFTQYPLRPMSLLSTDQFSIRILYNFEC